MIEKSILSKEELNGIRFYLTDKYAEIIEKRNIIESNILAAKSIEEYNNAMNDLKINNEDLSYICSEIKHYF